MACGTTPDSGFDLTVASVFRGGGALAAVAVSVDSFGSVAVVELLAALAVSSAVAGGLLALVLRGEAGGQDAAQRRALVGLGEGADSKDSERGTSIWRRFWRGASVLGML